MQRTELLVKNRARPCRGRLEIQAAVLDRPRDLLGVGVVIEQRDGPFAVGEEIDAVAHPHRVEIVGILARNRHDTRILQVGDPDLTGLPAAISFPGFLPLEQRHVRDMCSVRRVRTFFRDGQRQLLRQSASFQRNGVQPVAVVGHGAVGAEQDTLAVGRPTDSDVRARMVSETLRHAAGRGNGKDIHVAVVLACEGDGRSVRREDGGRFHAGPGGKTLRFAAFARHAPQITRIGEHDLRLTQGRVAQEQMTSLRGGQRGRNQKQANEWAHDLSVYARTVMRVAAFWRKFTYGDGNGPRQYRYYDLFLRDQLP